MNENGQRIPKFVYTIKEYKFKQRMKISNNLDNYWRNYYDLSVKNMQ